MSTTPSTKPSPTVIQVNCVPVQTVVSSLARQTTLSKSTAKTSMLPKWQSSLESLLRLFASLPIGKIFLTVKIDCQWLKTIGATSQSGGASGFPTRRRILPNATNLLQTMWLIKYRPFTSAMKIQSGTQPSPLKRSLSSYTTSNHLQVPSWSAELTKFVLLSKSNSPQRQHHNTPIQSDYTLLTNL